MMMNGGGILMPLRSRESVRMPRKIIKQKTKEGREQGGPKATRGTKEKKLGKD